MDRLAPTVTRVVICVYRAFVSTDQEKRETARSSKLQCALLGNIHTFFFVVGWIMSWVGAYLLTYLNNISEKGFLL